VLSPDYNSHFGYFLGRAKIHVDVEPTLQSLVDLDTTFLPGPRVSSDIRRIMRLFPLFGDNDDSALKIVTESIK
jgi:hypothetical protein